jgi:hypothetical protein
MAFMGGLAALLGLGLLDQTSPRAVPDYAKIAFEYGNDDAFVQRVEAAMPRGAMIFQLPVISFPEHLSVNVMHDYDHARGYLHARHPCGGAMAATDRTRRPCPVEHDLDPARRPCARFSLHGAPPDGAGGSPAARLPRGELQSRSRRAVSDRARA